MELDFVSEVDKKFYSDNFLLSDDWAAHSANVDELSCLLGGDNGISADDFMQSLPDELGMPMLDSGDILMDHDLLRGSGLTLVSDSLCELSDSSDSGLDCGSILVKDEPLSPASSLSSDTQMDATALQFMDMGTTQAPSFSGLLPYDIKLESPPLTPERDQDIVDFTTTPTITQPSNCVKIDFANNKNGQLTKLPPGSKIITGANGVRIIQSPVTQNLSQVLQNKVKIQPKPPAPLQPRPAVTPQAGPGKPLVLTAEEFAKLTQQGVLKFQHPSEKTPSPSPPPVTTVISAPPMVMQQTHRGNGNEFKVQKRQQRMIKNRESACLSRKRKKEYVNTVEKQLVDFSDENARLKEQNDQLRKRIKMLQMENEKLKSVTPAHHIKKATVVLGVLFLISLNLGPLTGILNSSNPTHQIGDPKLSSLHHHGRTLLAFNDNVAAETETTTRSGPNWTTTSLHSISAALEGLRKAKSMGALPRDLMMVKTLEELNIPVSMCPSYFNSSESERLVNELTGWVLGHKAGMKAAADAADKLKPTQEHTKQPKRRQPRKRYAPPRKLKAAMKPGLSQQDKGQYEVQVFTAPDRDYQDFLQAIHRRNDTFYVVSFRRDHLLLPATAHNQTMRPRMSLLMPAVSTNETMDLRAGNIAMMQIDCEVTATKLLHVHKSTVPTEDPAQGNLNNHTAAPSVDRSQEERRKWQEKTKWRP